MDLEDPHPGGPPWASQYEYEDMQSVFNPQPEAEGKQEEIPEKIEEGAKPEGAPPQIQENTPS